MRAVVAAAALLLAGRGAGAQDGGRHAAIVLQLPASARAAALGDAYVGVGGDAAALFYDPAQLATLRRAAALSVERYLQASTLGALAVVARVGPGGLAAGVQTLRYDAIGETVDWEPTERTLTAGDLVTSLGYGAEVRGRALRLPGVRAVRVGAVLKYARQRVGDAAGGAVAGDASLAVVGPGGAVLALVAQNVGGDVDLLGLASPLPRRAALGASVPVALSPRASLLATAAVARVSHQGARLAGGAEVRWRPRDRGPALDLRVGLRERTHGAAASPVTAGGGVGAGAFALDYAYQGYSVLGSTHRLGVRWAR